MSQPCAAQCVQHSVVQRSVCSVHAELLYGGHFTTPSRLTSLVAQHWLAGLCTMPMCCQCAAILAKHLLLPATRQPARSAGRQAGKPSPCLRLPANPLLPACSPLPCPSLLGMLLDGGRRVELQTDGAAPAAAAARLVTGMRVQVAGRWGRSPTQAPCFLATTLEVTSTLLDTALGTVDTLLGTVVGTVDGLLGGLLGRRLLQAADDGAGGAPPLVTPSSNQLAAQDVSTIFIPSEGAGRGNVVCICVHAAPRGGQPPFRNLRASLLARQHCASAACMSCVPRPPPRPLQSRPCATSARPAPTPIDRCPRCQP